MNPDPSERSHLRLETPGGHWEMPIDLNAMLADDALLNTLAAGVTPDDQDELTRILTAWRAAMAHPDVADDFDMAIVTRLCLHRSTGPRPRWESRATIGFALAIIALATLAGVVLIALYLAGIRP